MDDEDPHALLNFIR
jgi:protein farnesyltransferase subunit beta